MVDDAAAHGGGAGGAGEGGEKAVAVLCGVFREFVPGDFCGSGGEVSEAGELSGGLAAFDLGGPAHDEWDAVAAFIDVGFVAAEFAAGVVAFGEQLVVFGLG